MVEAKAKRRKLASAALIVSGSPHLLGMLATGARRASAATPNDWLMRERGPLPVPSDIAIVAIDEKSIAAYGRFPWPRQVLAKTIDSLAGCEPKVIAVDVLFADPPTRKTTRAGPVDRPRRQCGVWRRN